MRLRQWILLICSIILGLVYISAGIGKVLGHSAFLLNLSGTIPSWLGTLVADWLPWFELLIGLLLVAGVLTVITALFATILGAVFMFHNIWMITHGNAYEPCSCFGAFEIIFNGWLSSTTALYVDIGLIALALVVYFTYKGKFINLKPWYWKMHKKSEQPK